MRRNRSTAAVVLSLAGLLLSVPAPALEPAPPPKEAVVRPLTYELVTYKELYEAAAADVSDLARTDPTDLPYVRYLDARPFAVEHRAETLAVLNYHVNSLSRHSRIKLLHEVRPWLWRLRLDHYRWDPATWETLGPVNFYHSISVELKTPVVKTEVRKVKKPVEKTRQAYVNTGYGYQLQTQKYTDYVEVEEEVPVDAKTVDKADVVPGPWVPPVEARYLVEVLRTKVPVIRADNFLNQTAIQEGRDGHGYYDWFGFKKLEDVEKFVRLDRKGSIEIERELAAIVDSSGVTVNNRQLFRLAALTGPWWESRDVRSNTKKQNALDKFLEDFKPNAFEIVFVLPNRLAGFYLADDKGAQQNSAPDFIASDQRSTNNDHRVYAGYSCLACHVDGGLRKFDDWMRANFDAKTGLLFGTLGFDKAKADRAEAVYFGPLASAYRKDVEAFAEAIAEATGGMKPAALSEAYTQVWRRYLDLPVTLDAAAAEAGYQPADARARMEGHVAAKGGIDLVLSRFIARVPRPLRREHFEERFALFQLVLLGARP